MDYSEFKRESANRHQSEKLLDRDIIRFERVINTRFPFDLRNKISNISKEISKKN